MTINELYKALRRNTKNKVSYFRSDWRVDRIFLRQAYSDLNSEVISEIEFVHVAKETGTYLFPVFKDNLDVVRPYLFGQCTRRKTLRDYAEMFNETSITINGNEIIQHYDGKTLRVVSRSDAHRVFQLASRSHDHTLRA